MSTIVFTPTSLFRLQSYAITAEWFKNFNIPTQAENLKKVTKGNITYIIENALNEDDIPLIVIENSGEHAIFRYEEANTYILDRIITVARSIFTNSVRIPTTWHPYHESPLFSIHAANRNINSGARINFNQNPFSQEGLFVFALTDEAVSLGDIHQDTEIYSTAKDGLAYAILADGEKPPSNSLAGITLSTRLPQGFTQGATIEEWYSSKLTFEQREFVDKPHDGPVRLRGAAGTGKTLSMVIKMLRDRARDDSQKKLSKYAFITHSQASVDMVNAIIESLAPEYLINSTEKHSKIECRTLYDLSHQFLRFDLGSFIPLSLDGIEGKILQRELIDSIIKEMYNSMMFSTRFARDKISPDLFDKWEACIKGDNSQIVDEIMNEFASVLDAESVRAGNEKGEAYAKGTYQRASWLLPLPNEIDRRFMLEIHQQYRNELKSMRTLSVDQMIGDFNAYLDSNRWDNIRSQDGYDAIFVDELHLFTAMERQLLHKLISTSFGEKDCTKRPPIFMAYDLKQSHNDAFTSRDGSKQIFSTSSKLQKSDLVLLDKVFRYTPEISNFLTDIDSSFPAIDIPGEWDAYAGNAQLQSGDKPTYIEFTSNRELLSYVMKSAKEIAKEMPGGGRRVAVLCTSSTQFAEHIKIANERYQGQFFSITDREPSSELRHAGKRFIFSMPEYVAGLQFDTVFLINADSAEAPVDSGIGQRRRFISNVYLGSSRAEKKLQILSVHDRGGLSDIFNLAKKSGSLIPVEE